MVILEENFKWHLEAFASELFICFTQLCSHFTAVFCNNLVYIPNWNCCSSV